MITVILDPKIVAELELKIVTLDFQKTLALLLAKMCHMKLLIGKSALPQNVPLWLLELTLDAAPAQFSQFCLPPSQTFHFHQLLSQKIFSGHVLHGFLSWHLIFFHSLRRLGFLWNETNIKYHRH